MGSFDTPPPSFSTSDLHRISERLFRVSGDIKELVSERDQNARLTGDAGQYVLKVANLGEDRTFLEFQNAALNHIAAVDETLAVPRLIPARDGADIAEWPEGREQETGTYHVRLLTYLSGALFSEAVKTDALYRNLGHFIGRLSRSLQGFGHAEAHRPDFLWNLDNVLACRAYVKDIEDEAHRELVQYFFQRYEEHVAPRLPRLRSAVIHNDANDNNLVVAAGDAGHIAGIIDFGDMVFAKQVNELAVVLAYALMEADDLVATARSIIEGYVAEFPLTEDEIEVLFDLTAMRLVMSVCISSNRAKDFPDNDYLLISQVPGFNLLERLREFDRMFLTAVARKAAGYPAVRGRQGMISRLRSGDGRGRPVMSLDLLSESRILVSPEDRGDGGTEDRLAARLAAGGAAYAIAPYGRTDSRQEGPAALGVALYPASDIRLLSPLPGRVVQLQQRDNVQHLVLEHQAGAEGAPFYTSYRWPGGKGARAVQMGQTLEAGTVLGEMKDLSPGQGRLFFQLLSGLPGDGFPVPETCDHKSWFVWQDICLDPNLVLGLPPETFVTDPNPPEKMMKERATLLAPSLSVAYARKIKMVRGKGAYLYDHTGRAYLDCVNNITHVGHCHPHVVEALSKQAALLNTNSRYLSEKIQDLAARILKTMPDPLSVMFFVNSGSEANELALRLTQTATGRRTMLVLDHAYHGNTGGLVDISPYKFNRKGGTGRPDHVRIADFPDPYRGPYRGYGAESGEAYARDSRNSVERCVQDFIRTTGEGPGAFIAESIAGVGGQVIYPDGFLRHAYDIVRRAGGLCIADEVQVGFGRVGSHMWAFDAQGVVPDIVTLGKPIGNGHPLAAVVTTREIAGAFANGMEYFNSFGGNPVSCAVGLAVLDVIEQEDLQRKASGTGRYLMEGLKEMARRHDLIGDVRGTGLFIGAELVKDHDTLEPATAEADMIIQHMRENGVLLSTDGPLENVLKLKPPMVFGRREADMFLEKLDHAFNSLDN